MDIRVSDFQDYTVKKMTMMNLIIAKNEFDPYDAMVDQLAIDSLQYPDRYISSGKVVLTNIKSVSK